MVWIFLGVDGKELVIFLWVICTFARSFLFGVMARCFWCRVSFGVILFFFFCIVFFALSVVVSLFRSRCSSCCHFVGALVGMLGAGVGFAWRSLLCCSDCCGKRRLFPKHASLSLLTGVTVVVPYSELFKFALNFSWVMLNVVFTTRTPFWSWRVMLIVKFLALSRTCLASLAIIPRGC